jgi:hypothetical protein
LKAGWIVAPCRIMDPDKQGAKAVFKVAKIVRDSESTTFHGSYAISRDKGEIKVPNHKEIREV